MLTMFAIDKVLETITKKHKPTPTRKFQRSPQIIGYEREDNSEMSSEWKEPLLSSRDKIDCDQGKDIKGVSNQINSVRVKVLLTKEEAEKLLAKCKGEGALDFKDVVNELMKLPAQRINVVSDTTTPSKVLEFSTPSKELELATILEEEEEEEYDEYHKKNV